MALLVFCLAPVWLIQERRMRFMWRELALLRDQKWRLAARALARRPGLLLDLGGGTPYQGAVARQDVGPRTCYLCLDISAQVEPHVVADIISLPLPSRSVDSILCDAVLEHVRDPQRAVDEMYRVLSARGLAMVSVPFIYPYHDETDYYRFTDSALAHMFRQFDEVCILPAGDYVYAAFLVLTGYSFGLVRRLSLVMSVVRSALRLALWLRDRLGWGRGKRDYVRGLVKSPVGWYVYCAKGRSRGADRVWDAWRFDSSSNAGQEQSQFRAMEIGS